MIGAIIGDIVGSRFEFNNIKTKNFELFTPECEPTDDSIMTIAVADAIIKCKGNYDGLSEAAVKSMRILGKKYPNAGYGGMFARWLTEEEPKPYNSYGNGAAMRVSACGWAAKSIEEAKMLSEKVTKVTHGHYEGLKGAESTAVAIFLARQGKSKKEIKEYIEQNYYRLDFTLDQIRPIYFFNETCQKTVPEAFECFFEADNFEDTIRNAISLGGDSDTLAAIACSIAEAYYGVPSHMHQTALAYLPEELREILENFEKQF